MFSKSARNVIYCVLLPCVMTDCLGCFVTSGRGADVHQTFPLWSPLPCTHAFASFWSKGSPGESREEGRGGPLSPPLLCDGGATRSLSPVVCRHLSCESPSRCHESKKVTLRFGAVGHSGTAHQLTHLCRHLQWGLPPQGPEVGAPLPPPPIW